MPIFTKILYNLRKNKLTLFLQKKHVFEAIRRCCFRISFTPAIAYPPPLPLPRDYNWVSGVRGCSVWPLIYELSCPCVADCTVGSVFAGIIVGILLTLLVLHGKWEPIKIFMLVIHISSNFLIYLFNSVGINLGIIWSHLYMNIWTYDFFSALKKCDPLKRLELFQIKATKPTFILIR